MAHNALHSNLKRTTLVTVENDADITKHIISYSVVYIMGCLSHSLVSPLTVILLFLISNFCHVLNIVLVWASDRLCHRVYRKPTHTNIYLHRDSHYHPANNQSWLPWHTEPKLFVTRIPSPKNWNFSQQFSRIMDTALSRYDVSSSTCNADHPDLWKTHLDCIHTLHPDSIWLTQQNAD